MATKKKVTVTVTVKPRAGETSSKKVRIMFVHAFCFANGVIGFGIVPSEKTVDAMPNGALPIAFAPLEFESQFRAFVSVRSEHSRVTDAFIVPGINDSTGAEDDIEAVVKFNKFLKKGAPSFITVLAA